MARSRFSGPLRSTGGFEVGSGTTNTSVINTTGQHIDGVSGNLISDTKTIVVDLHGTAPATAGNYDTFLIADGAYQITAIREAHTTAGADAGAVSLEVEKLTGTQAPGAGVTTQAAVINLKGTANTVVSATLSVTTANLQLAAGDRLALKLTGTPTSVAGLVVVVTLKRI